MRMDPVSDENNQEIESTGDVGFSQSEVDALFEKGAEEAGADESAADKPPPSNAADSSQADGDALADGSGARTTENVATETGTGTPTDEVDIVSQTDIDALLSTAQGDADAANVNPALQPGRTPNEQVDLSGPSFGEKAIDTQSTAAAQGAGGEPPSASAGSPVDASPLELSDFGEAELQFDTKRVTMLNDVNLRVKLQLGKTKMLVEDILNLDEGSVVELDKLAGDPIDVLVNDRLIARGEVLILNDNFCVRISEVLTHDPHRITT